MNHSTLREGMLHINLINFAQKLKEEKHGWPRAFYKLLFAFASQPPEAMHAATAPTRFQSR